ncbi:hypothetical protein IQ243_13975 [Nostocales cyanobacterium LEGE 11386]|nr:hypothetical protein [Nostocales cyanobacterium LEGE 11386]
MLNIFTINVCINRHSVYFALTPVVVLVCDRLSFILDYTVRSQLQQR